MGVLLLVRHAQGSFGTADYDRLSTLGVEQAALLGRRLAGALGGVRRVVTGGLRRQVETAAVLLEAAGVRHEPEVDRRWDEYDADAVISVHLGATPDAAPFARDAESRRAFQLLLDAALARWVGGTSDAAYAEPFPAFTARVTGALDEIAAGSGTTVVVTSAGTIAAVCARQLSAPPAGWAALTRVMVNASITKLVTGRSGLSLVSVNDHAHLETPGLEKVTYR